LTVLFYGSFIPLHGVHHIVDAAHALRGDGRFKFVLLGGGQTLSSVRATYAARSSGNVEFRERVSPEILPSVVREADICLGVFGTSDKARRVVPNKVWQALAAGRPVVTGDGRGAREFLTDGHDCLLVPHGDGERLASALVRLADDGDLAARLAENGARLVHDRYTSRPIGRLLCGVIEAAIDSAARRRVTSIPE
jgi:glycosyltransferase involved in cell wall biosynthesis